MIRRFADVGFEVVERIDGGSAGAGAEVLPPAAPERAGLVGPPEQVARRDRCAALEESDQASAVERVVSARACASEREKRRGQSWVITGS